MPPDELPTYGGPYHYEWCPLHYLRESDPWKAAVLDVWRDYQQGVVVDWPDRYTAAVVEAVRFVTRERNEALASAQRRQAAARAREHERQRRIVAGG